MGGEKADSPFRNPKALPFISSSCLERSSNQAHALSYSGHGPYLTSVRKDASSHLVVSFIWLKSPSQIRGIKPESPCSGKEERHSRHSKWKQPMAESVICQSGFRLKGPACQPQAYHCRAPDTPFTPLGLLPSLWNEKIELSNFYTLGLE